MSQAPLWINPPPPTPSSMSHYPTDQSKSWDQRQGLYAVTIIVLQMNQNMNSGKAISV